MTAPRPQSAFTLIEVLVATSVLALLVVLIAMLFNNASSLTTLNTQHLDADAQARLLMDRMALDFSQMLRRKDVDYYLKSPDHTQPGNDRLAFYSEVPGYYSSADTQSPISLVAYRINANTTSPHYNSMERLGKGLLWNGVATTEKPMVFLPLTIEATWPQAADSTTADADYEKLGSHVFRFEYYYLLRNGTLTDIPWDVSAGHTQVDAFRDVAAVGLVVAVIDPRARQLLTQAQLTALSNQLVDFGPTMKSGDLENQWKSAIASSALPQVVISSIRVYGRTFTLGSSPET